MCTVSYIKHQDGFSLTSNRDEQSSRSTVAPKVYEEFGQNLIYPKDQLAGGTWIASSDQNISVCLLNGAFSKHKRHLPYNRSRGQVLKERFAYNSNQDFINKVDLDNVEPFTLLMIEHQDDIDFMELVWDGNRKHTKSINTNQHHIWASATLYDEKQRQNRQDWFKIFIDKNENINPEAIMSFHTGSFTDEKENDMLMQREHQLKTLSVTQINISSNSNTFIYKDLESKICYNLNLNTLCRKV